MTEYYQRKCNQCEKLSGNLYEIYGWISIDAIGIDVSSREDNYLPADLCSLKCLETYLSGISYINQTP